MRRRSNFRVAALRRIVSGTTRGLPVTQASGSSRQPAGPPDPLEILRSKNYVSLLVLGALLGVPVAAIAYFYLDFVSISQKFVFSTFPKDLG